MKIKQLLILLTFFSTNIYAQVVINEFSAANYNETDFLSGSGTNYADWIELYNTGTTTVDLSGYYLSDKLTNPQKWQIPAGTSISAGNYLVFLADGQDDFSSGYNHTNFKLTQTKGTEYIVFADATGTVLESIVLDYPNKKNDSRARLTDGSPTWGVENDPNPGSANNTTDLRYALTPVFNIPAGFYTVGATLSVELSTSEPTSTIRYTLDGSKPNSSSTIYTTPISLMNTSVIRAKTYTTASDVRSSHTETNTYFVNETHTTKVISLAGGNSLMDLFDGTQNAPQGSMELFETDGTFLTEATGEFNKHGNDSWAYQQRGVDFVSRDQFGKNYALLDEIFDNKNRDEFQRVILKCGASDNYPFEGQANFNYFGEFGGAHIRDSYINEMSQLGDLRLDERSTEFAVVYVNGQYWGVYDIREKTDDHDFTNYYYDQDRDNIQYLKTWGTTWAEYGGNQAETDWDNLVNFITTSDMTIPANYDYVDSVYNTGSLIDYFILNGFIVNSDWLNWNTSWWRGLDQSGDKKKWRYTLWDMDATFNHYTNYSFVPGQGADSDPCDPATLSDLGGQGHVPIWNALNTNSNFVADYGNRYAELASTVFSCDSMHGLLTRMTNEIIGEMPSQINRWGGSMAEWQENIDSLHAFIDTRCANVISDLVDCDPNFTGPYQLTLFIDPPGSGKVQMGSVTPATYPFTATYFGSIPISLTADPDQCWEFDYWTINNDTLFPNNNSPNVTFDLSADDSITVHYMPTNCIYIDVQPPGAGIVTVDGNVLNSYPNLESLTDSVNHLFDVTANTGYTFNSWDWGIHNPAPSNTSTNTIVYTYTNDTVIVNFDAILMDTIVYTVNPPGSGFITVAGTPITVFPNTQYYPQGNSSTMNATANTGFTFNNWDFDNNNPMPNSSSNNININWISNDSVVINFDIIPSFDITYMTDPVGAGNIDINTINTTIFPNTLNYFVNSNVTINANNNPNFIFTYWESNATTINPNINTSSANFNVITDDTIVAHYDEYITDTLWVITNPTGVAQLQIGADNITTSPFMGIYEVGEILNVNAIPNGSNVFNQWNLSNISLPDYNSNSYFIYNRQDTLYAYFNNVLGIEDLGEDITSMKLYPTLVDNNITIEISAKENSNMTISLFNLSGQKVNTLFKGMLKTNQDFKETFQIKASKGIYLVKINTDKTSVTQKIVLVK